MTRVKHGWSRFVLVLVLVFLVISSTPAQNATGTILGVVKDNSGAAVPNANVTVVKTDTGQTRTATTAPDGTFRFPQLQTGGYTVRVSASGFETAERKGVTLEVAQEAALDYDLQVGSMTQTVTVSEAAPLVDTTSSQIGNEVNEQKISDLPLNGRNWTDLTLLQPGITQSQLVPTGTLGPVGTGGLMFSSGGATLWSNMFMIDGANMINAQGVNNSSIIGTSLGVDGVKEYKTITSLFSAEYGLVMGSQTTIVSKGGTNSFHGDVFEYIRNSALDARNHFDALDVKNDNGFGPDKSLPYPGKRIPPFQRNNFGGAFGGPIQKDKTFFWLTFEGLRQHLGQTIATTTMPKACFVDQNNVLQPKIPAIINTKTSGALANPFTVPATSTAPALACVAGNATTTVDPSVLGLADLFPQPNVIGYATLNYTFPYIAPAQENYGQARLDHTFSDKDFVFGRYTHDESDLNTSSVSAGLSSAAYQGNYTALHSASQFVTLSETHIFSTSLLNTAHFSYSRTVGVTDPYTQPSLINSPVAEAVGQDFGSVSPGGGVTAFSLGSHAHFFQNNYQVGDDANWTRGKHSVKFGTLIQRYAPFHEELAVNTRGSASFGNLANFFAANYSSIAVGTGSEIRNFSWSTYGFYIQDDYHVLPRLTVNLGLRYEFETVPKLDPAVSFALRNPLTDKGGTPGPVWVNPSLRDFSPRIGFAWDVTGRGTTSVRGGAGIYYDIGNHGSALVQLAEGTPPINITFQVNNTSQPCRPLATPPNNNPCFALPLPMANNVSPGEKTVEYNLTQPKMYQYNLGINQQLPWNMGLTASYVGSRGNNLMQITEGNPTVPVGIGSNGLPFYCSGTESGGQPTAANPCSSLATFPGRANPNFGLVFLLTGAGDSWYNSLQLALTKRITKGLQFQATYTWSKLLDDGETQLTPINGEVIQAPGENWDDKGPAAFDSASNARINILYHAPAISANRFASHFLNGWWFGTILAAQTGYPVTPVLGADRALQNNTMTSDRPNLDTTFSKDGAVTGNPNAWFNTSMFDVPAAGTLGNAARGLLRGPGLLNLDFSVNKDFKTRWLGEQGLIEFRTEMFNIINHTNYANPNTTIWTAAGSALSGTPQGGQVGAAGVAGLAAFATAGQVSGTTTNSRQIQFAVKVMF